MKFKSLGLAPFGSFTKLTLDFSGGSNLHIIHGPNEAGKSTTLRAIRGFLFGIPPRSSDVHTHEGKQLRIRATLLSTDGSSHSLVRRKGIKNDLLLTDDSPTNDAVLQAWLGGVNADYFNSMFGLTHNDLVEGGQSLLAQGGALGEALFGAGTGSGMRSVLATLQADAKELFTKTGKNPPLNKAIALFKEAKKLSKEAVLKPKEWTQLHEALTLGERRLDESRQKRKALEVELHMFQRLQRVIPKLEVRRDYRKRLAALPEVPRLHESAKTERIQAERQLLELQTQGAKLEDEMQRNISDSSKISVSQGFLDRSVELTSLAGELGAYNKASGDLSGLRSRIEDGRAEIETTLRALGKEVNLNAIEDLRVTEPSQAKLRHLANTKGGIEKGLEQARRSVQHSRSKLDELEATRSRLPALKDASTLALLVKQAQTAGDLEAAQKASAEETASQEHAIETSLGALGRYVGNAEACCALPVPTSATVDECRSKVERITHDLRAAKAGEQKLHDKQSAASRAIQTLQASGIVPTLLQLKDSRSMRDQNWSQVRGAWLDGPAIEAGGASKLAEAFSTSILTADQVADKLRDDAERTGSLVTLELELQQATEQLDRQREHIEDLKAEEDGLEAAWLKLWEPTQISPGTPTEMRGWLELHEKLAALVAELAKARRNSQSVSEQITSHHTQLSSALSALDDSSVRSEESLSLLLERCRATCEEVEVQKRAHEQWRKNLAEAKGLEATASLDLPVAEEAMQSWFSEWAGGVKALGLPGDAAVGEMEAVLRGLSTIFDKWASVSGSQTRVAHIEDDRTKFANNVAELVSACDPQLRGKSPAEAAAALGASLGKAVEDETTRRHLLKRKRQLEIDLADNETARKSVQSVLSGLMARAGVNEPALLVAIEQESESQRALKHKLANTEDVLLGEGVPIDTLEAEAKDISIDSLAGSINDARQRLNEMETTNSDEIAKVTRLRLDFENMDASGRASEAAENAQNAAAEIRSHAAAYARLILAEHLLGAEIERYRKKNQGPVLRRAGEMFRRMTLDGFKGLTTEYNDKDEPILVCVRDTNATLKVSGLSEGTRDQLFLALRLASLELHAKNNEPLPLVMDDLLINFDDERAAATLALLSEVAETTQILFFSHHSHLLELARRTMSSDSWKEHRLSEA